MVTGCPVAEIRDAMTEAREQELDEKITAMLSSCEETMARLRDALRNAARALERF